jgi:hypothetical protein
VDNLPHATFKGKDAQLEAAIKHLQKEIKEKPIEVPAAERAKSEWREAVKIVSAPARCPRSSLHRQTGRPRASLARSSFTSEDVCGSLTNSRQRRGRRTGPDATPAGPSAPPRRRVT